MNSTSILEQFVVKGKVAKVQGRFAFFVIITAIVLLAIAVYAVVSASNTTVGESASVGISLNPELMVAERYAADVAARGETLFEITNPELNLVQRLEQVEIEISQYPSPELMVVEREAPGWVVNPELNLVESLAESVPPKAVLMSDQRFDEDVAAGSELTIEQKYATMGIEFIKEESVYANPELNLVSRFAESIAPAAQSANPELMVAGRFAPETAAVNTELTIEQKYAVMGVEVHKAVSIYENPEVFFAQKFLTGGEPVSQYPNPELTLAQRYAIEGGAGSTQWVVNPEVIFAQKLSAPAYDSSFLAANPEIKIHLQFIDGG